jgi:hypothetical protein
LISSLPLKLLDPHAWTALYSDGHTGLNALQRVVLPKTGRHGAWRHKSGFDSENSAASRYAYRTLASEAIRLVLPMNR